MKVDCDRVIWLFVMYCIYGCVQAIPTYRVYRLYDNNIIMGYQLPVWVFCVHQPSIYVLVVKAEIVIRALCIPLILTMLTMIVWTHNQT